jgi:PleD family two-component response regulator
MRYLQSAITAGPEISNLCSPRGIHHECSAPIPVSDSSFTTSRATLGVFVVDDDVSVRESLESLICGAGSRPHTFATAEEFLSCPRVFGAIGLVLDGTLPDLSGLDLQKRIAADRNDIPIVMIESSHPFPRSLLCMPV